MSSTRLPEKTLLPLGGTTVLEQVVSRTQKAESIGKVVVATSDDKSDDPIATLCKERGIPCVRGSLDDVLDRYYKAAKEHGAEHIARITGDCPLIEPTLIDRVAKTYEENDYDYVSTGRIETTFPDGVDTEIFSFKALERAWKEAKLPSEREHVTPYIWNKEDKFAVHHIQNDEDLSNIRITLDEPKDYDLLKILFGSIETPNLPNVLSYLKEHPEVAATNGSITHEAGYAKSLEEDKAFMSTQGTSQKLWEKAKTLMPGAGQLLSKRSELHLPNQWPSYFKQAKGCEVTDLDGNTYIDMSIMSVGACNLGYADEDVNKAVKKVIDEGNISTLNAPEEVELTEELITIHPWADMARFARTGGEAVAIAVRIARAHSGKDAVAFCGYHGWTDWYLAANLSHDKNLDGHLLPGLEPKGVPRGLIDTAIPFEYNRIDQLEAILEKHKDVGTIVMEPMRHTEPKDNFLHKVRDIADKHNLILVFDEISSGFRIGFGGIHLRLGVTPDMAVLGKAMSNGYPMAAVIGKRKVMSSAEDTFISSNYWTERIGPVSALATIKKMREKNVPEYIHTMGGKIGEGWKKLIEKHALSAEVHEPNALITLDFQYENKQEVITLFIQEMLSRGFLAYPTVFVSYAHKNSHVEKYLNACDEVFALIKKAVDSNTVLQELKGPVRHAGFKRLT